MEETGIQHPIGALSGMGILWLSDSEEAWQALNLNVNGAGRRHSQI